MIPMSNTIFTEEEIAPRRNEYRDRYIKKLKNRASKAGRKLVFLAAKPVELMTESELDFHNRAMNFKRP